MAETEIAEPKNVFCYIWKFPVDSMQNQSQSVSQSSSSDVLVNVQEPKHSYTLLYNTPVPSAQSLTENDDVVLDGLRQPNRNTEQQPGVCLNRNISNNLDCGFYQRKSAPLTKNVSTYCNLSNCENFENDSQKQLENLQNLTNTLQDISKQLTNSIDTLTNNHVEEIFKSPTFHARWPISQTCACDSCTHHLDLHNEKYCTEDGEDGFLTNLFTKKTPSFRGRTNAPGHRKNREIKRSDLRTNTCDNIKFVTCNPRNLHSQKNITNNEKLHDELFRTNIDTEKIEEIAGTPKNPLSVMESRVDQQCEGDQIAFPINANHTKPVPQSFKCWIPHRTSPQMCQNKTSSHIITLGDSLESIITSDINIDYKVSECNQNRFMHPSWNSSGRWKNICGDNKCMNSIQVHKTSKRMMDQQNQQIHLDQEIVTQSPNQYRIIENDRTPVALLNQMLIKGQASKTTLTESFIHKLLKQNHSSVHLLNARPVFHTSRQMIAILPPPRLPSNEAFPFIDDPDQGVLLSLKLGLIPIYENNSLRSLNVGLLAPIGTTRTERLIYSFIHRLPVIIRVTQVTATSVRVSTTEPDESFENQDIPVVRITKANTAFNIPMIQNAGMQDTCNMAACMSNRHVFIVQSASENDKVSKQELEQRRKLAESHCSSERYLGSNIRTKKRHQLPSETGVCRSSQREGHKHRMIHTEVKMGPRFADASSSKANKSSHHPRSKLPKSEKPYININVILCS